LKLPSTWRTLKYIEYTDNLSIRHFEEIPMQDGQIERIQDDLAVIRRALAFQTSFGKEMLLVGMLLTLAAAIFSVVSLSTDSPWMQAVPFAACMALCLTGGYIVCQRNPDISHELKLQVVFSIATYFAVICAASGYLIASFCGTSIGTLRTAALYAASLSYIIPFSTVLVVNAIKNRERHYCLGLAIALLLTGLIIPIAEPNYIFALAHGFMAVGFLAGVAIQRYQLRQVNLAHAPD
jgi:hypothetical protein